LLNSQTEGVFKPLLVIQCPSECIVPKAEPFRR